MKKIDKIVASKLIVVCDGGCEHTACHLVIFYQKMADEFLNFKFSRFGIFPYELKTFSFDFVEELGGLQMRLEFETIPGHT